MTPLVVLPAGPLRHCAAVAALLVVYGGWPRTAAAQSTSPALPSVTVVGSMTAVTDAGRTVEVITRAEIDRSTARNVAELLAVRAGVDVYARSPAQADISLRGSTAEQTLILVDGIRVSDAQSAHYALDLAVPLDAIERVELLKGAASALYGPDAVGGVVNIVTRNDYRGARIATRGGAWGTVGASAIVGVTRGGWNVSPAVEYEKSDGWRAGTDHRIGSARISALRSKGAERIQAHLGTGIRDFGANTFYGAYDSFERTGATTADVSWQTLRAGWLATTTASTRYHTDRFTLVRDNPAIYENLHRSWQSGGSVTARRTFPGGAAAFSADATNFQLGSSRLGDRREWRRGTAAQVTWTEEETGATADIGTRADHSDEYGGFVSPSVAVSVPVGDGARLRTSASRGFRAPTWTERFYSDPANQGNEALAAERFWSGEAGLTIVDGVSTLDVAYFIRRAENLIDWVKPEGAPAGTKWQATNVGTANYAGWDGSLAFAPAGGLTYSVAIMELKFTDSDGEGLVGKYALRPVTSQRSVRAAWTLTATSAIAIDLVQARRFGEDRYVTGNARLTWAAAGGWIVTIDGTNLANAGWLDASGIGVAGRAVHIGINWRTR